MRVGKLDSEQLNKLVLSKLIHVRPEVISGASVGVDCACVDFGGRLAVFSTDPITSACRNIGALTVHVSCNDAAAAGAEPIGLLVTLLLPPSADEALIGQITDDLALAARRANVEIVGGHTEITAAVTRPVTCATVIARAREKGPIMPSGMKQGDDIVMTKHAGLEGAAIIAEDLLKNDERLTQHEYAAACGFPTDVSVVKEGLYAAENGAHAMHDVTEGGIWGALWEMAEASGCSLVVDKDAVVIHPVTRKICSFYDIDPYKLISSGCMLIACEDGHAMVDGLCGLGIEAAVIARVKAGSGVCTLSGETIEPPQADELYKAVRD